MQEQLSLHQQRATLQVFICTFSFWVACLYRKVRLSCWAHVLLLCKTQGNLYSYFWFCSTVHGCNDQHMQTQTKFSWNVTGQEDQEIAAWFGNYKTVPLKGLYSIHVKYVGLITLRRHCPSGWGKPFLPNFYLSVSQTTWCIESIISACLNYVHMFQLWARLYELWACSSCELMQNLSLRCEGLAGVWQV